MKGVQIAMVLQAGHLINTGTSLGLGTGTPLQRLLSAGDIVEWGLENLESPRQTYFPAP